MSGTVHLFIRTFPCPHTLQLVAELFFNDLFTCCYFLVVPGLELSGRE